MWRRGRVLAREDKEDCPAGSDSREVPQCERDEESIHTGMVEGVRVGAEPKEREEVHMGHVPSVWFGRLNSFTLDSSGWDATFLLSSECLFLEHLFYLFIKILQHRWNPEFPLQVHPS